MERKHAQSIIDSLGVLREVAWVKVKECSLRGDLDGELKATIVMISINKKIREIISSL